MGSRRYFNGAKTLGLFVLLWAVMLGVGSVVSGGRYFWAFAAFSASSAPFIGYWNSATLAIRAMHARPVTEVEQPAMYRIVRELSREANQPMPQLYVSPTAAPNAFATGRNPSNAAVCCTEGILELLDERELRGVLGHELMHVYNRDILIGSVAAAIAGIVTSVAHMAMWFGGGRNSRDNPFGSSACWRCCILAPLAATLIRMSISRTREYDADEDGVKPHRRPRRPRIGAAQARGGHGRAPAAADVLNSRTSATCSSRTRSQGVGLARMFSTHPPMEERIARLEAMNRTGPTLRRLAPAGPTGSW